MSKRTRAISEDGAEVRKSGRKLKPVDNNVYSIWCTKRKCGSGPYLVPQELRQHRLECHPEHVCNGFDGIGSFHKCGKRYLDSNHFRNHGILKHGYSQLDKNLRPRKQVVLIRSSESESESSGFESSGNEFSGYESSEADNCDNTEHIQRADYYESTESAESVDSSRSSKYDADSNDSSDHSESCSGEDGANISSDDSEESSDYSAEHSDDCSDCNNSDDSSSDEMSTRY